MKKLTCLFFAITMVVVCLGGGIASGQCLAGDGNDTAADAQPIGLETAVSEWVCPDDPYDYYYFEIPEGADVAGDITLESPQVATVLRVADDDTAERIIDDWSTDETRTSFTFPIGSGVLAPGRYLIRVFFWSSAAYDHQYTLTLNLPITWTGDCIPDGNETPETASELTYGAAASEWVCPIDRLDIWRFNVNSGNKAKGKIALSTVTGDVFMYLYDSSSTELFSSRTACGLLDYALGDDDSPLAYGDYYIGIFLPAARGDEVSYTLSLSEYVEPFEFPGLLLQMYEYHPPTPSLTLAGGGLMMMEMDVPTLKAPWRATYSNPQNTGRSSFTGPEGSMIESCFYMFDYDIDDLSSGDDSYTRLLAGADDRLVFTHFPDKRFYVYNLDVRRIENYNDFSSPSPKPPAFDSQGKFYAITSEGHLACYDEFQKREETVHTAWQADLPGDSDYMSVELVGRRICASYYFGGWHLRAYDSSGDLEWNYGPMDSPIVGACEDTLGAVYIQTEQSLYRFNANGDLDWRNSLPMSGRALRHQNQAPIIDAEKHIHVDHALTDYWYEYNAEGLIVGTGQYYDRLPKVTCFGSDGYEYQVNGWDSLYCYGPDPASPIEWMRNIDGDCQDMILDNDHRLYVCYRYLNDDGTYDYRLESMDTTLEGETIHVEIITNIAQDVCELNLPVSLAIGPDNKIVLLHSAGLLYSFGPWR